MRIFTLPLTGMILVLWTVHAGATTRYVDLNCTNATPPFTDWTTAATNIQDAVDAAVDGDLVLVTNGVYATGGRVVFGSMTNRVAINKAVTVQSVNGAAATVIKGNRPLGNGAVRCVYLTNNAVLIGFTLTNGATRNQGDYLKEQAGGGAWCESTNSMLANCLIVSNTAFWTGGGCLGGELTNCFIANNVYCLAGGGGISGSGGIKNYLVTNCIAINCVVSNNMAGGGGGAFWCALINCVIQDNRLDEGESIGGGAANCSLTNCLVTGNSCDLGGGLGRCTATGCVVSNNLGLWGGGAYNCNLTNCMIVSNLASNSVFPGNINGFGGGANLGTLNGCTLVANAATAGGGGAGSTASSSVGTVLYNCVLSNNSGGATYSAVLNNCLLVGNGATSSFLSGCKLIGQKTSVFSAYACALNGCLLIGNTASSSSLNNCTIVGQTNYPAATNCLLQNCILYFNPAGNYSKSTNRNCCTLPLPVGTQDGGGNFTNAPLFADLVGGEYHLQSNSPCINAGHNSFVTNSTDLDGNPRIVGGTVDIGAYEYQSPSSILSYAWAQQYGLPTDGSADFADTDGDGLNNYSEWIAGTVPTNNASVLVMNSPTTNAPGLKVSWQSVSGKTYFLQRSTNLLAQPAFSSIQSNLVGAANTTTFSDTTATNGGPYFYRVGVQ